MSRFKRINKIAPFDWSRNEIKIAPYARCQGSIAFCLVSTRNGLFDSIKFYKSYKLSFVRCKCQWSCARVNSRRYGSHCKWCCWRTGYCYWASGLDFTRAVRYFDRCCYRVSACTGHYHDQRRTWSNTAASAWKCWWSGQHYLWASRHGIDRNWWFV